MVSGFRSECGRVPAIAGPRVWYPRVVKSSKLVPFFAFVIALGLGGTNARADLIPPEDAHPTAKPEATHEAAPEPSAAPTAAPAGETTPEHPAANAEHPGANGEHPAASAPETSADAPPDIPLLDDE